MELQGDKTMKALKILSIRIERDLWLALRRMEEDGRIKSIVAGIRQAISEFVNKERR
jgi:hypothetical protein